MKTTKIYSVGEGQVTAIVYEDGKPVNAFDLYDGWLRGGKLLVSAINEWDGYDEWEESGPETFGGRNLDNVVADYTDNENGCTVAEINQNEVRLYPERMGKNAQYIIFDGNYI